MRVATPANRAPRTTMGRSWVHIDSPPFDDDYRGVILSQGPWLYWRLGETSGTTATDESGNGRNGTYAGTYTQNQTGALGGGDTNPSVDFATDARVAAAADPFVSGTNTLVTVTGWAWLDTTTLNHAIFGGDGTNIVWFGQTSGNRNLEFVSQGATSTWTNAIPATGQWFHFALILRESADTTELYINGSSVGTGTSTAWNYVASHGNFIVGVRQSTFNRPWDGKLDEIAVFTRELSADEISAQYITGAGSTPANITMAASSAAASATLAVAAPGIVTVAPASAQSSATLAVTVPDGGAATAKLSVAPPDTTGYTTFTITQAMADITATGYLQITLSDTVDYVIQSDYVIRRAVRIDGGRNIVWTTGAHIHVADKVEPHPFPDIGTALLLRDGASPTDGRIIHIEGLFLSGNSLTEGIDPATPSAHVRIGNCLQAGRAAPMNSDQWGGTQMYVGGRQHSDSLQTTRGPKSLTIENCTFEGGVGGLHLDEEITFVGAAMRVKAVNLRTVAETANHEGPMTETETGFSAGTTRDNFDVGLNSWTNSSGSTVTRITTSTINGAGSMQATQSGSTNTDQCKCVVSYGSNQDWSGGGGAIAATVRLDAGGDSYPMARIDITDDSTVTAGNNHNWFLGQPQKISSTAKRIICQFPTAQLQTIRKVRICLMCEGTTGTHTIVVDDIMDCAGSVALTWGGSSFTYAGKWSGFYKADAHTGTLHLNNFWVEVLAGAMYVDGVNYDMREWNGSAYVDDLPPGTATLEDGFYPSPSATTDTDSIGTFVKWDSGTGPEIRNWNDSDYAKAYQGPPPSTNFVTSAVAGLAYSSAGYYADVIAAATSAQSSATLTVSTPVTVPLDASSGVSSATLALTAPTTVALAASSAISSATLALTAPTTVTLGASSAVSSATLLVGVPVVISLSASSGIASATLALTAPTTVTMGASSGVSSATLALTAPTQVPFAASSAQSSATLALTATTYVPLGAASAQSSATLAVTAGPGQIACQSSNAVASATLALTAATQVPLGASSAVSSATLALTAPTRVPLNASSAVSSATLTISTPTAAEIPLSACSAVSSTGVLNLFTGTIPEQHPNLGGDLDVVITGGTVNVVLTTGVVDARRTAGTYDQVRTGGTVNVVLTGGRVDTSLTGIEPQNTTGGTVNVVRTGGTVNENATAGVVNVVLTGGVVVSGLRGGDIDGDHSGEPDEPSLGGTYDQNLTGGEVY